MPWTKPGLTILQDLNFAGISENWNEGRVTFDSQLRSVPATRELAGLSG
jgi:hypothetical protein